MNSSPLKALLLPVLAASLLLTVPFGARAGSILTNGNFSSPGTSGQLTVNSYSLTGWTGGGKEGAFGSQTTPPVFVFALGTANQLATTGVMGDAFMGTVDFYGVTAAPGGGAVVAADGDPAWAGSISQTVSGLMVGDTYSLTFNWAGAQQQGFSGPTTEKWQVSFGGSTQTTSTVSTPSQTFEGWQTGSLTFTATSASEALTFLAVGSPSGEPPWLLLNGVSLTDTTSAGAPEPGTLLLLGVGGAVLVGSVRRRRKATRS